MSSTYYIYTEAKIRNKWRCIDGTYFYVPYGKTEEKTALMATYINGSRSYFEETYEEICRIGNMIPFTELSPEVQAEHPGAKHVEYFLSGKDSDEITTWPVVDWNVFKNHVPKGYQYHGVYHKNSIEAFNNGEIKDLWEDESVDLSKLTDIERQCYEYKEWDSEYSWQHGFKEIKDYVGDTIRKFLINDWSVENLEYRIVAFCF